MAYLGCGCWEGVWNAVTPPPKCATHALPDSELTPPYGLELHENTRHAYERGLVRGRFADQRPIEIVDSRSLVSMVGEILELLGAEQAKALDAKDDVLYDAWHEAQLAMQQTMRAIRRAKKAGA